METIKEFLANIDPGSFSFGFLFCMLMDCIFALETYILEKAKLLHQQRKENENGKEK